VTDEITIKPRVCHAKRPLLSRLTLEGWAYLIVGVGGLLLLVLAGRC
jgi:hypothetical protein